MKATEFVKKFGLDEAKEIVDGLPEKFKYKPLGMICWDNNSYKYSDRFKPRRSLVNMADLKRLVESHENLFLIWPTLEEAKKQVRENGSNDDPEIVEIYKSWIKDVEACQ